MELNAAQLKRAGFESARNSSFTVSAEGAASPDVQLALTALHTRPAPPGFEQFSLMFSGPAAPLLPQGIYCFKHEQLGELPLFMVPVGKRSDGIQYEVCISRATDDD